MKTCTVYQTLNTLADFSVCNLIFFISVELGNQLLAHYPLFKRVILKYLQDNLFLSLEVMVDYCQQYT